MSKDTDTVRREPAPVMVAMTASAASTGSLEALLGHLPPQAEAAIVVVLQHMEVFDEGRFQAAVEAGGHEPCWIEDGMTIEAGRLYLTPPDMIVTVGEGVFLAHPTDQAPTLQGVIDSFLVSLARERRERAIGVALEGTDGDGTLGARELKAAGGVVLAEAGSEDLAHTDSAAALADAVLPVEEIATRLLSLIEQAEHVQGPALGSPETQEILHTIATLLRQKIGHDFHGYKPGTFLRRVHRRMLALLIDDLHDYVELLRTSADEAQNLFNDLLIGVTEFFRDPKEWEILEKDVIPRLFEGHPPKTTVRVWAAGCSTGEEAYSLAILLAEHRATLDDPPQIQIFASDLDGRSLAVGRAGRYPESIAGQMPAERLARWFVREGDTYCVVKELREMCIFSQHSLIKDAPFSRLDLISCRNLLIYLDGELQEKVIPLFHFALRPGGFLFLGNSENASRHQSLFAPIEARSRIFRRLATTTRVFPDFPFTSVDHRWSDHRRDGIPERQAPTTRDLNRWAEHVMERHNPAFVVIDEAFTVLHFSGAMGRYLAPSSGAASLNLLQLVHPVLRAELRTALLRASEEKNPIDVPGLEIGANGQRLRLDLVVEPRLSVPDSQTGFVVVFKEYSPGGDQGRSGSDASGPHDEHLSRLEEELRLTRDRLQATIEELESTNEELKSSNEEYQSLNEELQSANEELETSKEELQSVNEELTTVNGELAHRVQELGRANSDLKNFLESTQIATLFLDNELQVTNFTPAIVDLFHLVESDEGRPITHIKARVAYDQLAEDARRVLRTLVPVERKIDNPDTHARYVARVLPYRSTDNFIAGVVVTFVDVTARRAAEERLRRSEERFRAIVEKAIDYAIFTTDVAGLIETWPPGAQQVFGWTAEEAVGQPVDITFTPEDREAGQPAQERRTALDQGQAADVRWHLRKDGSRVFIDGMARPLLGPEGQPVGFLKIGQDVTEQRVSEARMMAFGEASSDVLWIRNRNTLAFEYVSPAFERIYGVDVEVVMRGDSLQNWLDMIVPEDRTLAREAIETLRAGERLTFEYRIARPPEGGIRLLRETGFPIRDGAGQVLWIAGVGHDATEERASAERLKILVAELQHRTRNLLGVVLSVTDRTVASSNNLTDFGERIHDRLGALARVNSLLSRLQEQDRIDFDELIRSELNAHGVLGDDDKGPQVTLNGPENVRLRSSMVQTLALGLHELVTNAGKYGALSTPDGRLEISWSLIRKKGAPLRLRVDWKESGVVLDVTETAALRQGYGRELIEQALPYQLSAEVDYKLTPEGVRCTITIPVSTSMEEAPPFTRQDHV